MKKALNDIAFYSLLLGISLTMACFDEEDIVYEQLTTDQLRNLYLLDINFVYSGESVELTDTIYFLVNKSDTVQATVITQVNEFNPALIPVRKKQVSANSWLVFETGAIISAKSTSRFTKSIYTNNHRGFSTSTEKLVDLDTALVLNNLYPETYKIDRDNYTSRFEGFERVFFALDYGYVLIELDDKTLYELIK